MTMTKTSSEHIVCSRCSRPAVEGSDPPLCERHALLAKQSSEDRVGIRDIAALERLHSDKEVRTCTATV